MAARARRAPGGFALVVTMALAVLLMIVGVGLLSLAAVTLRGAALGGARAEARANARLGLLVALNELQRDLGPDRRVSATAAVLDEDPASPEPDGVTHPHWTAVWSTEWPGTPAGTPWARDDGSGGLRDRRGPAWTGSGRADAVVNYLVSGNEGGRAGRGEGFLDARDAALGAADRILLVGPGSVDASEAQAPGEVVAKRVAVHHDDRPCGAYAYWVGDLGVKANLAVVDRHRDHDPGRGGGPEGIERLLNAQDAADEFVDQLGELDDAEALKCPSQRSVALGRQVRATAAKARFHDITTSSRSVLANARDGGLQRDLSAYLQTTQRNGRIAALTVGGKVVSPGIEDADSLVGPPNAERARAQGLAWTRCLYREIAPRFGLLRHWAGLGAACAYASPDHPIVPPARVADNSVVWEMINGSNVYDYANLNPASFLPHDQANLTPVMVEGTVFYNLAAYPERPGQAGTRWIPRLCLYPRVALWNPYNVELKLGRTIAQLFVNGNKRVRFTMAGSGYHEMDIPFGRGSGGTGDRHPAHYRGTVLWALPAVTMEPGETLVFSPVQTAEYAMDLIARNALSPTVAPDASRYFYKDYRDHMLDALPRSFVEWPESGVQSGADNYVLALKHASGAASTDRDFDDLPLIVYINAALQAGGSDELPVRWNSASPVPVYQLSGTREVLGGGAVPDVRTRDGIRLRWWREHPSNLGGSGRLQAHPRHFQSALIADWNPRAAYFCRTPWENLTNLAPHFFGAYTRDLFDQAVTWGAMQPRYHQGRMTGAPFSPPAEGPRALVLFEVPRRELGIPSLAYLRHLKLSEFGWHPSYAIGNSLADPRVGLQVTSPVLRSQRDRQYNGWNKYAYGWGTGDRWGHGEEYWAQLTREILFNTPQDSIVVYDLSFEANFNLWDDFFLSTGTREQKERFLADPSANALPNGRIGRFGGAAGAGRDVHDFHRAALHLALEGGFNVHSTSKEAWKALLASTADTGFAGGEGVPFPRVVNPPQGEWRSGGGADDPEATAGFRSLTGEELDALAEQLVCEVKRRAPFLGLADFVNRRLAPDATGRMGPVQAAIDAAGLNAAFDASHPLDNSRDLPDHSFDNIADATRLDQSLKPASTAWGVPAYLTQGDVLQVVGSTLRARSDSFVIRACGESTDAAGTVQARAWCEAVVQRVPQPCRPDATGLNPLAEPGRPDFGRQFRVVSFRWLATDEV